MFDAVCDQSGGELRRLRDELEGRVCRNRVRLYHARGNREQAH